MSYLELSVREIIESAVIQTLKDKVKLLVRRHPGAEPILSGNLKKTKTKNLQFNCKDQHFAIKI
jgi:hypothetical protein